MKLEKWLELHEMKIHVFAKKIGKSRSLVHKYIYENVIPRHEIIVKIYRETHSAVSANDFHNLSDALFESNKTKNSPKETLHANSFR